MNEKYADIIFFLDSFIDTYSHRAVLSDIKEKDELYKVIFYMQDLKIKLFKIRNKMNPEGNIE